MRLYRYHVMAFLVAALGFIAGVRAEQINKCTGEDGKVVYQKQPCDKQQIEEQKTINPDHNTLKMEVPPPSEEPKVTKPATAPTKFIERKRGGY